MNRRRFLQALGLAPLAAKTYVFFGGILRPQPWFTLTTPSVDPFGTDAEIQAWLRQVERDIMRAFADSVFYGTECPKVKA